MRVGKVVHHLQGLCFPSAIAHLEPGVVVGNPEVQIGLGAAGKCLHNA